MFERFRAGTADKSPLSIAGDGRGVLCLHGITGTPFEVRPLAEALGRRGCTVEAPMLAGHGGTLARPGRDAAGPTGCGRRRRRWTRLQARVGRPARSRSAASRWAACWRCGWRGCYPERISALVVMSTPLRLRRFQVAGHPRAGAAAVRLPRAPAGGGAQARRARTSPTDDLRYENPGLRAFPIAALEALLDLMDTVRADLPAIRTPALVVHGRQDHTVPMEDSLELTGCLGSEVIERLWLDNSFHLVALDVERARSSSRRPRFLAQHAWPPDRSRVARAARQR